MPTKEEIEKIHEAFNVPCTTGGGTGIGGSIVAAFTNNVIISLDSDSAMPSDKELGMLQSYREFVVRKIYNRPKEILEMQFPASEGHNTIIFLKGEWWHPNGREGWCFRRMTWNMGPLFYPPRDVKEPCPPPWNLIQLLDKVENLLPKEWEKWKTEHPEIFTL